MRERERPSRPVVTVAKIVRTAIQIADAEGIDALSMRRIATEMGSGTTSLYRHVTNKDELIDLMVEAVHGEHPLPEPGQRHWRAELADWARQSRATMLRHPWLVQQASRRTALGPNVIAKFDHLLGVLGRVTEDATLATMASEALNAHVLGEVTVELADLEAQRRTGMTETEWQESMGAYVTQVVESGRYPHFNRRILESDNPDADRRFEFSLECLLAGIEAMFQRAR